MSLRPRTWRDVCLEDLAALVPPAILDRGRDYFRRGHVTARLAAGDRLSGSVLGGSGWYTAQAALAGENIEAECTCPYQGPFCKHAAALVLAWLEEPGSFHDLSAAIAGAGREDLARLARELALAAPRKAIALLTAQGEQRESGEALAALAGNLLSRPKLAWRDPEALAERLDWILGRLSAAAADDPAMLGAAVDLASRLLAVWGEASDPAVSADLVGRYLRSLAGLWPREAAVDTQTRGALLGLFQPEAKVFAGELGLLVMATGCEDVAAAVREAPAREVLDMLRFGIARAGSASIESVLLLLDAYERADRIQEAAALARSALRRPDGAECYVLRQRLARYCLRMGARRQAAAYLTANFKARPDVQGWEELRRIALSIGEWARIRRDVQPSLEKAPDEVRIRAALDEKDRAAIVSLNEGRDDLAQESLALRAALADLDPEQGLPLLLRGLRACLDHGGYAARRQAAGYIRAAGGICRRLGRLEYWRETMARLRADYPAAANWPELGALFRAEEEDLAGEGEAR